jgi:hypothetical protein
MILNKRITNIIPASICTGDEFFINAEAKIRAMIRGFGYPHLFVTLTFSEGWKSYLQLLRTTGNQDPLPSNRPWEAVQYYYRRYQNLKDKLLRNKRLNGFGALQEFVERHEFQQRGAIHTHSLLWVQRSMEDLISEDFIRADVPDAENEPELHQLVMRHQIHTCSQQLCRKDCNNALQCRKGFPADLSHQTHQKAGELRFTYKRQNEEDRWVVPYAPRILLIWDAHCNVQYCTSGGLAKYISKYVTKPEPKGVYSSNHQDAIAQHITARRLGSMEVMALLLSKPIFHVSSNSIYLSTAPPKERSSVVKPAWMLHQQDDTSDLFFKNSFEKYAARPQQPPYDTMKYFEYFTQCDVQPIRRLTAGWIRDSIGYQVRLRHKV